LRSGTAIAEAVDGDAQSLALASARFAELTHFLTRGRVVQTDGLIGRLHGQQLAVRRHDEGTHANVFRQLVQRADFLGTGHIVEADAFRAGPGNALTVGGEDHTPDAVLLLFDLVHLLAGLKVP